MDASASSRLAAAIQARDASLVINTPEEADFWDAMVELGVLHTFIDINKPLTMEDVFEAERADELAKKKTAASA
jgi:hypothetical protein